MRAPLEPIRRIGSGREQGCQAELHAAGTAMTDCAPRNRRSPSSFILGKLAR